MFDFDKEMRLCRIRVDGQGACAHNGPKHDMPSVFLMLLRGQTETTGVP